MTELCHNPNCDHDAFFLGYGYCTDCYDYVFGAPLPVQLKGFRMSTAKRKADEATVAAHGHAPLLLSIELTAAGYSNLGVGNSFPADHEAFHWPKKDKFHTINPQDQTALIGNYHTREFFSLYTD